MVAAKKAEAGATRPFFASEAIRFLRGLTRHNDRDWFNQRKPIYEAELRAPMLALIDAVNERMASFAPDHIRPAPKVMLRIYRDIRFSSDKRPYKTHLAAWWGRGGMHKTSGAGFYFDLGATAVTIAAGLFVPEREQLVAERRFLLERGDEVRASLQQRSLTRLGMVRSAGQPLSRVPKGFPPDHPAEDLLRCREWGVSCTLPNEVALGPELGRELYRRFRASASLVDLLNEPLVRRAERPMVSPLPF